jgi:hypothetical protein
MIDSGLIYLPKVFFQRYDAGEYSSFKRKAQ